MLRIYDITTPTKVDKHFKISNVLMSEIKIFQMFLGQQIIVSSYTHIYKYDVYVSRFNIQCYHS